jgi:hypothetical protein
MLVPAGGVHRELKLNLHLAEVVQDWSFFRVELIEFSLATLLLDGSFKSPILDALGEQFSHRAGTQIKRRLM